MRKLFLLFVLAAGLVACEGTKTDNATEAEATVFTVADINEDLSSHVGEEIQIQGTVVHVCTHGGGKLFLAMNDDKEVAMKIMAGESGSFVADDMIDKQVVITGVVEELRKDEAYVAELEAKLEAKIEEHKSETASVTEEEVDAEEVAEKEAAWEEKVAANREYLANLREEIANSENGYIPEYNFMCSTFEITGEGNLNVGANECVEDEADKASPEHDHDHEEGHDHDHEGHDHE
jgi:hypothetical protein